jgi:alkanesulfonate monooxygenase SsuD/methylene tetrahydromethanopterin reductase-like flavin-dependent oxidoreductase (luciferase family)
VRAAVASRDDVAVQAAMSERWLGDVTLYGSATTVRDGAEAWQAAGVKTVILVPSSTRGGQMVAFEELIAAYR